MKALSVCPTLTRSEARHGLFGNPSREIASAPTKWGTSDQHGHCSEMLTAIRQTNALAVHAMPELKFSATG